MATYKGKSVKLNNPRRISKGETSYGKKKSVVYVTDGDKIKRVTFGDPEMTIKKTQKGRRKNFRARHNCDNPGPKTKARYWSCKAWQMADTFLKIGTSFPQGARRLDGQNEDRLVLNIPSQAAADELSKQGTIQPLEGYQSGESRRSLVDWFAPERGVKRDIAKDIIGGWSQNFGLGVADIAGAGVLDAVDGWNYLKDMSQRNRDAEASVRQELIDKGYNTGSMDFFKELQRRLPEKESAGEAVFDFAFGGLELGLAAKFSFKSLGNFFKRFNGKANALPTPEINVVPADTPQFGALAAAQQQADTVDADFIPFEDIRLDTTQPMNIVQTTPEEIPQGDVLFSPSLRAAKELTQDKGSYEQLRAMMIKNGAKADELEWSGANNFFSGKKVTKDEIIDYLEKNDPRLVPNVRKADGALGFDRAEMPLEEAMDQVMGDGPAVQQWMDEELALLADYLPDNDYFNPNELTTLELENSASQLGTRVESLRRKKWAYKDEDGDIKFFDYDDNALAHQYGGRDNLDGQLEQIVRSQLEDDFANDPPNFIARYDLENPDALDAGDTQYSEYFPEGGTDYSENLFQYRDPTERIGIDVLAGSKHFGEDDAGTIFHTRHADYVDENGDTVRYVGEIQSDPQQSITKPDITRNYSQSLYEEEMQALTYKQRLIVVEGVEEQKIALNMEMNEFELNKLMHEASIFRLNQLLNNQNSYNARRASELGVEGEIPFSGELTDAQEELLNEYIGEGGNPYRGIGWTRDKNAQDKVYEYLVDSKLDWLPESTKKRIFDIADDTANKKQEIENQIIELEKQAYGENSLDMKPGGPFMTSQNKWLDEALRRSIYDAVNDPDVDYLAFPNDPDAIAKVGGQYVAKEGTVNYYQRDVQNRLKKLLKSFSTDTSIDTINIGSGEVGSNSYFNSKGFKITPEFKEAVLKKGIPTYAVPLAVSTGAGYGALDQVGGQDGKSGS